MPGRTENEENPSLSEDWIELHNVVPSIDPSGRDYSGSHDATSSSAGVTTPPDPKPLRRALPHLTVDTSRLDPQPSEGGDSAEAPPPKSAILGLAKGRNLFISNWLPEEKSEEAEKSSPYSPSKTIGSRRPSTNSYESQSSLGPRSPRSPHSPHSPTLASVSSRKPREPSSTRQLSQSDQQLSDHTPQRTVTPIPQLTLTVEKSFQHTHGDESPSPRRSMSENVFDDTNAIDYEYESSIVASPASKLGLRRPSNTSADSLHPNSAASASAAATTASLDVGGKHSKVSPANSSGLLAPPGPLGPRNLSLSGTAYSAQKDFLDAEEANVEVDSLASSRGHREATTGGSDVSVLSSETTETRTEYSFDDTTYREVQNLIRNRMKEPVGRTLFYFTAENGTRRFMFRLVCSDLFRYVEIVLTIVQVIVLCVEVWSPFEVTDGMPTVLNHRVQWVYCGLYVVFTLMAAARAISFGMLTNIPLSGSDVKQQLYWLLRIVLNLVSLGSIKGPRENPLSTNAVGAYNCLLRKSWGRVDFISIVFFWVMMGFLEQSTVHSLVLIISGLSHLRILRLLDEFTYTRIVLHVLKTAMPVLQHVFIFIGFFLIVWGVTGLQSFNGSLRRVCVYKDIITSQNCGSWLNPESLERMPYLLLDNESGDYLQQSTVKGYTCPVGSKCVELRAFPKDGDFTSMVNQSFDNIFNALELVFVMLSNNGFTDILYNIIDSEYMVSSLFFISGVLVLGIWLMNLLVAVMVSSYSTVRDRFDDKLDDTVLLKMVRLVWNATMGSVLALKLSAPTSEVGTGPLYPTEEGPLTPLSGEASAASAAAASDDDDSEVNYSGGNPKIKMTPKERKDHSQWILQNTVWGKRYGIIYPIFPILTVIDLIVQASKTSPNDGLFGWELGLAITFGVEILFRFWVYLPYWRYFFLSWTNMMDVTLAVANCIILAWYHDDELYAWLTCFQLLRVYRMVGALKYSRVFWLQVFGNFKALASLTAFFSLCTYLSTLIATKMLRGQFAMKNSEGEINEMSFYDLAVSFFAMYQVASTEDWTDVLFWATNNVSRPGDNVIGLACMGILFCGWLFFANFLIFNLFVGIMSESLYGAIENKREEQVKQFFEEVKESQYSQRGPLFGRMVDSFALESVESENKLETEGFKDRPVKLRDKLLAKLYGIFLRRDPDLIVPRPMRSAIERQFVIEFLEAHITPEQLELRNMTKEQTFLSLSYDKTESYGFDIYLNSTAVSKLKAACDKVYSWLHHYPQDYRGYLFDRLESQRLEGTERDAHRAYVEEMYDQSSNSLAVLKQYCEDHPKFDCSLYCFSNDNRLRRLCQRLVPPSNGIRLSGVYPKRWVGFWVKAFFLSATISIVVITCIYTPLKELGEGSGEVHRVWTYSRVVDLVFGIIFTVELLIKVVADGFHFTPNAYTWNTWNCLDLIVLISIWMTFINDLVNGLLSRYIRALLALRALRLISFFYKSELLFNSVFRYGLKNIMGACLIGMSIVVPYSIWGKNIFHDRLKKCNDDDVDYLVECTGEYVSTLFDNFEVLAPRRVEEEYFNYNNFWQALLIQFGVLSLEGWVDVLHAVTSISGKGKQPSTFASTGNGAYPILYHFLGAVLIMTMLVAVIIRNYALTMGTAYLTEQQLSWIDVKRTLQLLKPTPKPPSYRYGTLRHKLLTIMPTWINSIELWTLFVASVDMASFFYPSRPSAGTVYQLILIACSILLVCLSVIRLIVLKPTLYFHNWWNPFGLIVCLAVTALSIADAVLPAYRASGTLNASRVAQICMLLLWIPRTKILYQFYAISIAALGEISMLLRAWFTLFVTYAIALNQSFGLTKLGSQSSWSRNFRTIPRALIALFTMSCGEGWNEFLIDFTIRRPYCIDDSKKSECGIPGFAYFLFISWNVISMYIFANLFISLVCEACWYVYRSGPVNISERDIVSLLDSWQQFDSKGTGLIRSRDLFSFLSRTQGYFSIDIFSKDPKYNVRRILEATQRDARTVVDPYNVDMDSINEYLADMPVSKYKDKSLLYEMFTTQAQLMSYPIPGGRGIAFSKVTQMFPLYKDMDPAETLSLKEFIELKVQLHEAKLTMAANFIIRRWRLRLSRARHERGEETPGLGYDQDCSETKSGKSVYWVT